MNNNSSQKNKTMLIYLITLCLFFSTLSSQILANELILVNDFDVPNYQDASSLRSIAYDGLNMYISLDYLGWDSHLYKCNMDITLSVADDFDNSSKYLTGMTFARGALWTSDNFYNITKRYAVGDPTLEVHTYPQPGLPDGAHGIAYDGNYFWLCVGDMVEKIDYRDDRSTFLGGSFYPGLASPSGMAWDSDRECLWALEHIDNTTILRQLQPDTDGLSLIVSYDLAPFLEPHPVSGNYQASGLTVANGNIWTCDARNFRVVELGVVPEPTTVSLLGLGSLAFIRKRRMLS